MEVQKATDSPTPAAHPPHRQDNCWLHRLHATFLLPFTTKVGQEKDSSAQNDEAMALIERSCRRLRSALPPPWKLDRAQIDGELEATPLRRSCAPPGKARRAIRHENSNKT